MTKKALPLSRLIALVGDDNVRLDLLQDVIVNSTQRKNGLTEIRFLTKGIDTNEVYGWTCGRVNTVGLVLWLPKRLVDEAVTANDIGAESIA